MEAGYERSTNNDSFRYGYDIILTIYTFDELKKNTIQYNTIQHYTTQCNTITIYIRTIRFHFFLVKLMIGEVNMILSP